MGGFDVSAAELQAAGSILDEIAGELRTATGSLHAQVESLLGGGWRGGAASGFAAGWQRWRTGAQDVLTALESMSRLLGTTGQGYNGSETSTIGVINQSGPMP